MKRYLKIYLLFLQLSWASLLSYRASFINGVISNLVWSVFHIIAILLLTSKTSSVYGWSRNDLILLVASSNIILGVFYFFCTRNFHDFSETINKGGLDSLLVKPLDPQFSLSFQQVTFYSITRILVGLGVVVYILTSFNIHYTVMTIL